MLSSLQGCSSSKPRHLQHSLGGVIFAILMCVAILLLVSELVEYFSKALKSMTTIAQTTRGTGEDTDSHHLLQISKLAPAHTFASSSSPSASSSALHLDFDLEALSSITPASYMDATASDAELNDQRFVHFQVKVPRDTARGEMFFLPSMITTVAENGTKSSDAGEGAQSEVPSQQPVGAT